MFVIATDDPRGNPRIDGLPVVRGMVGGDDGPLAQPGMQQAMQQARSRAGLMLRPDVIQNQEERVLGVAQAAGNVFLGLEAAAEVHPILPVPFGVVMDLPGQKRFAGAGAAPEREPVRCCAGLCGPRRSG